MIEKVTIPHPLKDIVLEYDRSKKEKESEKTLISIHIVAHDKIYALVKEKERLVYEFSILEDNLESLDRSFKKIENKFKEIEKELSVYAKSQSNIKKVDELRIQFDNTYELLANRFHAVLKPFNKKIKGMFEEVKEFHLRNRAAFDFLKILVAELKVLLSKETNTPLPSLDLLSFDDDLQLLFDFFKGFEDAFEANIAFSDKYYAFNDGLEATFDISQAIKSQLTQYYDVEKLLECSLSESYANGMGDPSLKPFYIVPPEDNRVEYNKISWGAIPGATFDTIIFSVKIEEMEEFNRFDIAEKLSLLQHFPKLLEKLVFSCTIKVKNELGLTMHPSEWKGREVVMNWFSYLLKFPCSIFFFDDHDVRAYILLGDLYFEDKYILDNGDRIALTGENFQIVCNRLFHACQFFFIFCHNTGFDPSIYIDALLADFNLPIDLEDVRKSYLMKIEGGIEVVTTFREIKGNEDEEDDNEEDDSDIDNE